MYVEFVAVVCVWDYNMQPFSIRGTGLHLLQKHCIHQKPQCLHPALAHSVKNTLNASHIVCVDSQVFSL